MSKPKREPWHPALYEEYDVYAMQALARGEASEGQQKRALKWIIEKAAMTYDEPFVPDNARVTDNLLGRRSVGLQIVKLLNLNPSVISKVTNG